MPECTGYCIYCKEEITDADDSITFKKKLYHLDCYNLMKEELNDE